MSLDTFTWVGFDPSLSHFGWSLFRDDGAGLELYRAGVWETEKDPKLKRTKGTKQKPGMSADTASRIRYLGDELWKLVQVENPVAIFVEALAIPFGRTSMSVVQVLGRVRGLVDLAGAAMGVPVIEFNSMTLKKLITGKGDADKAAVAKRITERFPQVRIFTDGRAVDDNVTDAIAVGYLGDQLEPVTEARRLRREHKVGSRPDLPAPWMPGTPLPVGARYVSPTHGPAVCVDVNGTPPAQLPPEGRVLPLEKSMGRPLAEALYAGGITGPVRIDRKPAPLPAPTHNAPTLEQLERFWSEDT